MKIIKLMFIMQLLMVACTEEYKEQRDIVEYNIDYKADDPYFFNDYFVYSHHIVLESDLKESAFISFSKVIIKAEKLYILCNKSNKIVIFDLNGKFLMSINRVGRAKDEYLGISDFIVYDSGDIEVLDDRSAKIIRYNSEGEFINSKDVISAAAFANIEPDVYVYHANNIANSNKRAEIVGDTNYNFYLMVNDEIVTKDIATSPVLLGRIYSYGSGNSLIYERDQTLYLSYTHNDYLYEYDNITKSLNPVIKFNFNVNRPDYDMSKNRVKEYLDGDINGTIPRSLTSLSFFDDYILGEFSFNLIPKLALISKVDGRVLVSHYKKSLDGIFIFPFPISNFQYDEDYVVTNVNSHYIRSTNGKESSDVITAIMADLKEDIDSEILLFYKLKK